ncbi:Hypothetical protein R9X50_00571900 [Acrodontium crateriforme]|uniref:RING-CH-type domain-containing protein n=1 Tax=Acrodontium crateriforme TaxID=150365 RepID=A0AAQ3RB53_9PEZI|nr:Hypothetical protein R9X50_00571900 [Acrodontium crateriforme]
MDSLSARQPFQRTTMSGLSSASQTQPQSSGSHEESNLSDQPPIVDLNSPIEPPTSDKVKQSQSERTGTNPSLPDTEEKEEQTCWICFGDSSEDTPDSSPWRDPCPCALTAHESCLLDFIADKESPTNSRNQLKAQRIECPQCKSEIKLSRPKDYLVDAVRAAERLATRAITPGALVVLAGIAYKGSMSLGIHSIYAVFGLEEGHQILEPLLSLGMQPSLEVYIGEAHALSMIWDTVRHRASAWMMYLGVPMIAPALILSRTSYADNALPAISLLFITAHRLSSDDSVDYTQWPPTASFAFACLPYVRSVYNLLYKALFQKKEERWLAEIQPRANERNDDGEDDAGANEMGDLAAEDINEFEIRIDGNIWEDDWEDQAVAAPDRQQAPPFNQPPLDRPQTLDGEGRQQLPPPVGVVGIIEDPEPAAAPPRQPQQDAQPQGERRLSFSPITVAGKVFGALLFPSIAGLSGSLLRLLLPKAWTTTSSLNKAGLLQHRWGRTLVGGCLFVACKDAVMLYVRWRMAKIHQQRRVIDYDRSKAKSRKRT